MKARSADGYHMDSKQTNFKDALQNIKEICQANGIHPNQLLEIFEAGLESILINRTRSKRK